jgi:carbon monoxide dehydrogenase subunit G
MPHLALWLLGARLIGIKTEILHLMLFNFFSVGVAQAEAGAAPERDDSDRADAWAALDARRLRLGAGILALAWQLGVPAGAMAQQINIATAGDGDVVQVTASADMQVDARTVWSVISDYDHLADFIPGMRSSRVVQRSGDKVFVVQMGEFGFLFFQQSVAVKLEVIEYAPQRMTARAVEGNLKGMEGRYEVATLPTGAVRLSYVGSLAPEFPVPPVISRMVVHSVLAKQFTAMVKEIIRRDALARTVQPQVANDLTSKSP